MIAQNYLCAPKLQNMVNFMALNLKGMSPHHVRIFRMYKNRSLTWCKSSLGIAPCVHELQALDSHQLQRLQAGPGFYMQRSHMTTVAVTVVSTAVWTLTTWNTHILKDRSFAHTQLGTDGAEICLLTITGKCNVRIQIPYTCTTSSAFWLH